MKTIKFKDYPGFNPNLTPEQVIRKGSFGGTYFRDLYSGVNKKYYKDQWKEYPKDWFEGLDLEKMVYSKKCDKSINKFKVKSGTTLEYWESKGWISPQDPYGWFQWYCRFYLGRRSSDDERQINRWKNIVGDKGRFKTRLKNMIKSGNDSMKIRQLLLQWGVEIE